MKTLRISFIMAALLAITHISFSQTDKTETIPVSGNCTMCKNTIEKAAKSAGATTAVWDVDAKKLQIAYNTTSTSAEKIQQSIANAGYDTRDFRADDKAYNNLPSCCKYDRASTNMAACCDVEKCEKSAGCCKK